MSNVVFDAGAFVAYERADLRMRAHVLAARREGLDLVTSSPVVGQVWRDGRRQVALAGLLRAIRVEAPDETAARRAGELLARSRTRDVVDALLVGLARDGDTILTSDPDDIQLLLAAADVNATVITV